MGYTFFEQQQRQQRCKFRPAFWCEQSRYNNHNQTSKTSASAPPKCDARLQFSDGETDHKLVCWCNLRGSHRICWVLAAGPHIMSTQPGALVITLGSARELPKAKDKFRPWKASIHASHGASKRARAPRHSFQNIIGCQRFVSCMRIEKLVLPGKNGKHETDVKLSHIFFFAIWFRVLFLPNFRTGAACHRL